MPNRHDRMTTAEFDRLLFEVIDDDNRKASDLLAFGGIYEILAEHYNNAVLAKWDEEHADDAQGDLFEGE